MSTEPNQMTRPLGPQQAKALPLFLQGHPDGYVAYKLGVTTQRAQQLRSRLRELGLLKDAS